MNIDGFQQDNDNSHASKKKKKIDRHAESRIRSTGRKVVKNSNNVGLNRNLTHVVNVQR
jgi:hypothetical protein